MSVHSMCGVIIIAANPEALVEFYQKALELTFEVEEHGSLKKHYGVDIGQLHFAIHPQENFKGSSPGNASIALAFQIESLMQTMKNIEQVGGKATAPLRDEGFGLMASYQDPEGNLFEVVELKYEFES